MQYKMRHKLTDESLADLLHIYATMERSQYNERYSLPDPCGSESRSTRYRAKKWAREQEIEQ